MPIPLVDVKGQYAPLLPELKRRLEAVLEDGRFILGPNVAAFEREAADYLGVPTTVGVANGSDALVLALDAMEIGPGDEVICPSFTFYATAEAIARRGGRRRSSPTSTRRRRTSIRRTSRRGSRPARRRSSRCTSSGGPAPLAELALGLPQLEDAAQAFGSPAIARVGVASTFSFYPTKNLFGLGDGGLVAATDKRSPSAFGCSASTARATRRISASSATTRASTRSRPLRCACS